MEAHHAVKGREDPVLGEFFNDSLRPDGPNSTSMQKASRPWISPRNNLTDICAHNLWVKTPYVKVKEVVSW